MFQFADTPDHPAIRNAERTGFCDGREDREPVCPICENVCETIYRRRRDGEVLGCDVCIKTVEPEDESGCWPDKTDE